MGRPIRFAASEVRGTLERGALHARDRRGGTRRCGCRPQTGLFRRFIRREPARCRVHRGRVELPVFDRGKQRGTRAAGRQTAVVLKHSAQTPLLRRALRRVASPPQGLPAGLFQVLHLGHADTERVIRDPRIDFVAFTGSVAGGRAVQRVRGPSAFIGVGARTRRLRPRSTCGTMPICRTPLKTSWRVLTSTPVQSCCGLQRIYVSRERP